MDDRESFERLSGYATYRPEGRLSFEESIDLLCNVIVYCREQGIGRVLIDATKITGFSELRPEDRFALGDRAARAAQAAVKVAIIARPELMDPERFGMTVARNRGLFVSSFDSEAEALTWLLDPKAE